MLCGETHDRDFKAMFSGVHFGCDDIFISSFHLSSALKRLRLRLQFNQMFMESMIYSEVISFTLISKHEENV